MIVMQRYAWWIIAIYVTAINVVTFIVFGADKLCAKRGWRRVPERVLFLLALLGGSIGAIAGMKIWHHKTMHRSFRYGLPAILVLQLTLIVWFVLRQNGLNFSNNKFFL